MNEFRIKEKETCKGFLNRKLEAFLNCTMPASPCLIDDPLWIFYKGENIPGDELKLDFQIHHWFLIASHLGFFNRADKKERRTLWDEVFATPSPELGEKYGILKPWK